MHLTGPYPRIASSPGVRGCDVKPLQKIEHLLNVISHISIAVEMDVLVKRYSTDITNLVEKRIARRFEPNEVNGF
jgi:hypothetical protein